MGSNVCLTTFISGKKYQQYLPLLLYSLQESYPGYTKIIFLQEELSIDVNEILGFLSSNSNIVIKENYFNDINDLNRFQSKALRWVIRDDLFLEHKYIYFIDSDIIYFREPIPLHKQHTKHMRIFNLPFSNIKRKRVNKNRNINVFLSRIKEYGLKNAIANFLKGDVVEKRLTGLHFVEAKKYFPQVKNIQKKYEKILLNDNYLNYFQGFTDEAVLYQICKESGFDLKNLAEWSRKDLPNLYSLHFNDFDNRDFRPHHGIHLGAFRPENVSSKVVNTTVYDYYISELEKYLKDANFIKILEKSNEFIKDQFVRMLKYYSIPNPICV